MVTSSEYARIIQSFLGELSAICASAEPEYLQKLNGFLAEVSAARQLLTDPGTSDTVLLSTAVGLVDEYVDRDGERVLRESYAFYRSTCTELSADST